MSLINDALKRAQNAQKAAPAPPPASAGLQPAGPAQPKRNWAGLLLAVCLAALGVSGWFFFQAFRSKNPTPSNQAAAAPSASSPAQSAPSAQSVPPQAKTSEAANTPPAGLAGQLALAKSNLMAKAEMDDVSAALPPKPVPPATGGTVPPTRPASAAPDKPGPAAAPEPKKAPEPVQIAHPARTAPPVNFSEFKLQGVFFRLKDPSAVINGRVLSEGDTIDGARVAKIQRNGAVLEAGGRTFELILR